MRPVEPTLVITADDYGYRPPYDAGILEAARAGAVDAVSAMVGRADLDPEPLLETRIEIGLHLELPELPHRSRAGRLEQQAAVESLRDQLAEFQHAFGHRPAYLDGHHHCHAREGLDAAIARVADELGLPVRSVNPRHRRLLRGMGISTPDLLVGRLEASEPALPDELARVIDGSGSPPAGVTEWMVHPGHRADSSASSYDAAREHDLELVLDLREELGRRFRRARHSVLAPP
jgi:predicted glycoside hydrolase/deacetylase ChbG (UPF0249 family)